MSIGWMHLRIRLGRVGSFLPCDCMQCNALYCCRNSVRPSVRCVYCDKTTWCTSDWYHTKRQSLQFSDTNNGCWAVRHSLWNLCWKWLTPFKKRRLRHISAYNVSTVRDSEKSSVKANIKSSTGFPMNHRWSAYVTPTSPKGWLKERFFSFFEWKSTDDRLGRCQLSSPVSVINIWWSAAMLITSTAEICVQQLCRVEEMIWLPYDADLSAAAETVVGFLKRVIVPPFTRAFLNFFRLAFRALGTHYHYLGHDSRMTSCLK